MIIQLAHIDLLIRAARGAADRLDAIGDKSNAAMTLRIAADRFDLEELRKIDVPVNLPESKKP